MTGGVGGSRIPGFASAIPRLTPDRLAAGPTLWPSWSLCARCADAADSTARDTAIVDGSSVARPRWRRQWNLDHDAPAIPRRAGWR